MASIIRRFVNLFQLILGPYEAEPVDIWSCGIILYVLMNGSMHLSPLPALALQMESTFFYVKKATPWDEPSSTCLEFKVFSEGKLWGPWKELPSDLQCQHGFLSLNSTALGCLLTLAFLF